MLLDTYHKNLPDYYPYMYLDGHTPEQIMESMHRTMRKQWETKRTEEAVEAQIEKKLEKVVSKALDDIFKGWK